MVGDEVCALHHEDAHLAHLELDPRQRKLRQQGGQRMLGLAHFADQEAIVGQVIGGIAQDAQRQVQAIVARTQAEIETALADWNAGRLAPPVRAGSSAERLTAPSLAGVQLRAGGRG